MEKQIHFDNPEGERLAGTLHLPAHPTGKGVVLGHCFTCSRHTTVLRQLGQALAASGFTALRFDFSGNGQSQGAFSESTCGKQIAEMHAAAGIVADQGASWIGMAGHSMGAVMAVLAAAASEKIRAVCTLAARLSGLDPSRFLNRIQIGELRAKGSVAFTSRGRSLVMTDRFLGDADRHDLPGTVRSLTKPLLIVHGASDEIVPVEEARRAAALNPTATELFIVPGADHMFSDPSHRDSIVRKAVAWFDAGTG